MAICFKCSKEFGGKVHFKTECEGCFSYLHSCMGCKNYCPGKPNDCLVPGTDQIRDRESYNYCEEFEAIDKSNQEPKKSIDDIAKNLFKDD